MQPVTCPTCGSTESQPVGFTWWGGLLGPKIFNLVRCTACHKSYNGKTGKDATAAIAVYLVVSTAVMAAFFFFLLRNL